MYLLGNNTFVIKCTRKEASWHWSHLARSLYHMEQTPASSTSVKIGWSILLTNWFLLHPPPLSFREVYILCLARQLLLQHKLTPAVLLPRVQMYFFSFGPLEVEAPTLLVYPVSWPLFVGPFPSAQEWVLLRGRVCSSPNGVWLPLTRTFSFPQRSDSFEHYRQLLLALVPSETILLEIKITYSLDQRLIFVSLLA